MAWYLVKCRNNFLNFFRRICLLSWELRCKSPSLLKFSFCSNSLTYFGCFWDLLIRFRVETDKRFQIRITQGLEEIVLPSSESTISITHSLHVFNRNGLTILLISSRWFVFGYAAGAGRPGFYFRQGLEIFLFATASKQALGPTQPSI